MWLELNLRRIFQHEQLEWDQPRETIVGSEAVLKQPPSSHSDNRGTPPPSSSSLLPLTEILRNTDDVTTTS